MSNQTVILHHYVASPFSEKLRLGLDLKGIPWRSCIHSFVLPRPFLTPDLTGTFRRIPVLQIDADIFCDTVAALPALDALFPAHPFNASNSGLMDVMYHASDFKGMFGYLVSSMPWSPSVKTTKPEWAAMVQSKEFNDDRSKMMGGNPIPADAMAAGMALWRDQLMAFLDTLETTVKASKTGWLMGTEEPSTADLHWSNPIWFIKENGTNADLLPMFPAVFTWFDKLTAAARANAHPDAGKDISPEEARNVAERASKAGQFVQLAEKFVDINGRQKGDLVAISSDELRGSKAPPFITGPLVESTTRTIAVRYTTPQGWDVVHHYPRHGYDVLPASL